MNDTRTLKISTPGDLEIVITRDFDAPQLDFLMPCQSLSCSSDGCWDRRAGR